VRIAAISDIHGNLPALEAVLSDIRRRGVDLVVCAGDVVNPFPGSSAVLRLLGAAGIPVVAGNHETYVTDFERPDSPAEWRTVRFGPLQWCRRSLNRTDLDMAASFPLTLSLDPGGVLLCHGTPAHNHRNLLEAAEPELVNLLAQRPERLVLCGHQHAPGERQWRGRHLIRVGSVGLPLNGDRRAQYAIFEQNGLGWNVERLAVEYDLEATLAWVRASGLLAEGGPLAWVFYAELRSAQAHLVPFFGWLGQQEPSDLPAWEDTIESYLRRRGTWFEVDRFRGKYVWCA
jgi:putative phosphoesterase